MRLRTLLFFTAPSAVLMLVFIFGPLVSVAIQSLHTTTVVREMVKVETCSPGFLAQICTTTERSQVKMGPDGKPLTETRFIGLDAYRAVLELETVAAAFSDAGKGVVDVLRLDFWRALRFTLTFTFITLPLVVGFGLVIALAVNNAMRAIRGPLVFVSLLPFVITPVIGALAIRWLFVGDGIVTSALRAWIAAARLDRPVVLVSHQVNITALANVVPSPGELVVLRRVGGGVALAGRVPPG